MIQYLYSYDAKFTFSTFQLVILVAFLMLHGELAVLIHGKADCRPSREAKICTETAEYSY
jgi:hypothetical protein